MKKIIFTLMLLLFCVGCSNVTIKSNQDTKSNSKDETKTYSVVNNSNNNEQKVSDVAKEDKNDKDININPPQKYVDYIKKDKDDEILFYSKEDIDLNGREEIIIGTGTKDDEPISTYYSHLYILQDNNGKISKLGDDLNDGGYGIYEVKIIQLKNMLPKYIYCGLTNGANLKGFKMIQLTNNQPKEICYSASATGAGDDNIKDFDNDGQIDGFEQDRWSYDVLYYQVKSVYLWKKNDFVLKSSSVEIPDYPDSIKEVIMQYLSLRVLYAGNCPEVDKRLNELCKYSKANETDIPVDVWNSAIYHTILEIDNQIDFKVNQSGNIATAIVSYVDENNKKYGYSIHLTKAQERWCIDKIN